MGIIVCGFGLIGLINIMNNKTPISHFWKLIEYDLGGIDNIKRKWLILKFFSKLFEFLFLFILLSYIQPLLPPILEAPSPDPLPVLCPFPLIKEMIPVIPTKLSITRCDKTRTKLHIKSGPGNPCLLTPPTPY